MKLLALIQMNVTVSARAVLDAQTLHYHLWSLELCLLVCIISFTKLECWCNRVFK